MYLVKINRASSGGSLLNYNENNDEPFLLATHMISLFSITNVTWRGSLVGIASTSYASGPEIDPLILHIL